MKATLILLSTLLLGFVSFGQQTTKHVVHFGEGQASISLEQLDSIKLLVEGSQKEGNRRIIVHTYANDAVEGETNNRLSRKRAYLVQQCLERTGVPLAHMQIENKVRHITEQEGCAACAEITVTSDSNFFFQNVYHDNIAEFLMEGSEVIAQTFWVRPFEEVNVTTKDGLLIHIPVGTLDTKDSALVKLEVRYLRNQWDMLLHSLATRSAEQEFLKLNRAIHLSVTQFGEPLEMQNNEHITVVVPSNVYSEDTEAFEQEGPNWVIHRQTANLRVGSFYGGDSYFCNNTNSNLALPNYSEPPTKPNYIKDKDATAKQDKEIKNLQTRLDYLDGQRVNEKGKPKELSPQQKRNYYLLKTQKDRLLIAKEKIRIETREKNHVLEENYYKNLANYNKQRNSLQHSYLKGLDSLGAEHRNRMQKCEQHQTSVQSLKEEYGLERYQKMTAILAEQATNDKLGYWFQTDQLGWVSIGEKSKIKNDNAVPYRVMSDVSAYKITAFLIFDDSKDVVLGETLDERDIIFWEVPDGKPAKLLAVTQEGDSFLVAFHELTTSGNPITLEFKNIGLKDVLGEIK